jgi:four helix bundle protein
MPNFRHFEDIEAWQRARLLTRAVYSATAEGPFTRDFGLRDQVRRAAVSVMGNIAEGFERDGTREFLQYLSVAKAIWHERHSRN